MGHQVQKKQITTGVITNITPNKLKGLNPEHQRNKLRRWDKRICQAQQPPLPLRYLRIQYH